MVEREAPGGQAGTSASIENYLGFPRGLSGADLTHRAITQVRRFGAELVLARDVVGFEQRGPVRAVLMAGGDEIEARAVLVATGVSYRKLEADGLEQLTGRGVYYGADASDAAQVKDDTVFIVGSRQLRRAGALNLARFAKQVVMVVRGNDLATSMSQYLVDRILAAPTISVRYETQVAAACGEGHLELLTLEKKDGSREDVPATLDVRLHRRLTAHRLARRADRARQGGLRRDRPRDRVARRRAPGCSRAPPYPLEASVTGRVRRRRRTSGLHEAGGLGRRRGRDGGPPGPPLPGDHLMTGRR